MKDKTSAGKDCSDRGYNLLGVGSPGHWFAGRCYLSENYFGKMKFYYLLKLCSVSGRYLYFLLQGVFSTNNS